MDPKSPPGAETPPAPPPPPPQAAAPEKPAPASRRHTLLWVTFGILVLAFLWFLYWLFYLQYHEYTDDAYANGGMININPAVSGSVVAFFADDTDLVTEGQLLVLLDRTDFQVQYEKELASLAATVLQVRQLYDTVEANRANFEGKKIAAIKARYDYENRMHLVGSQAISNEEFIHSKDDLQTAEHALKEAEAQLLASLDAAGNTPSETHPRVEEQKGNVRSAFYRLQHCSIFSPATGYVAQRTVDVGQWVTPTTNMLAVIPTDYVWVDANYKETQLTYMRVGQPASVWFDIYGSHVEYKGKVLGIASGSGSVFSLIPPQNATGNWIKIVQRLPVRISLDRKTLENYPVRLGISAEVNVDITNQDLPMLVQTISLSPVTTTRVFDIHLDKVNKVMEEVIRANLKKE